jgi:hypothetical protein
MAAEDFFAGWDDDLARGLPVVEAPPPPPPDQAATESIPTAKPSDTGVLPPVQEPYLQPAPPGAPPGPPPGPARVAPRTAPPKRGFPVGATFALLGAAAVVVSALIPWTTGVSAESGRRLFPRDIEFANLLLGSAGRPSGPELSIVLLGAGLLGAFVALVTMGLPILKFLRRIIGLLTLAIPVLFVFRGVQGLLSVESIIGGFDLQTLIDSLGAGVYVAAAGAFTQIVAGRWFRR